MTLSVLGDVGARLVQGQGVSRAAGSLGQTIEAQRATVAPQTTTPQPTALSYRDALGTLIARFPVALAPIEDESTAATERTEPDRAPGQEPPVDPVPRRT